MSSKTLMTAKYTDAISLHLSSTLVPLFVAVFMSLLLAHNVSLLQWQAMWLQVRIYFEFYLTA